MSVTNRSPLRMAGANLSSGNVNTGELNQTRGGGQAASFYSGAVAPGLTCAPGSVATGSDVLIFSGAGRLKSVTPHQQISGVAITFYDGAAAVSGGPLYTSGHKPLGVVPANTFGGGPGETIFGAGPTTYGFGEPPFQSGLIFNSRSGQPGFTVTWIPETNNQPS